MANIRVTLLPNNVGEQGEQIDYANVTVGFNQLGWFVVESRTLRTPIAGFPPGSVKYFTTVGEPAAEVEVVDVIPANVKRFPSPGGSTSAGDRSPFSLT